LHIPQEFDKEKIPRHRRDESRLKVIAEGRPIAELIRTAVTEYVEKKEKEKRRG
jgi:hypothetical protein